MRLLSACLALVVFLSPSFSPALAADEAVPASRAIALASGTLDVGSPALAEASLAEASLAEGSEDFAEAAAYVLVKFDGPVTARQYRALERSAERIYTYLPHDAYLVRMPAGPDKDASARLGARWVGPYQPSYKLSPVVSALEDAGLSDEEEKAQESERIVMIQVYPDADLGAVVERIREAEVGEIVGVRAGERFSRIRLLARPSRLARGRDGLARIPQVFWVDLEARRELLNDTTIWVSQSGTSGGGMTPIFDQGIYGEGQIVGVLDTGIDADMCYFRDPALGLPPRNECNGGTTVNLAQRKVIAVDFLWSSECAGGIASSEWDTQDHGSHVAGTVAGDNFANPLLHNPGDGIAPGAKLVIQDCGFQTDNCADCPGIGCPVVDLNPIFQQAYTQGARIHTNSWGDAENDPNKGRYTAGSQDADEFMWNHKDFLLLFAAGNDGPGVGSVGSPSTAKNVVSVGATLRSTSANSMASFSSCGPTDDGRIKPDVTMPGSGIISANADRSITSNNCGTKSSSGTSMASPGAAGASALIRQYYTDGWYPTGGVVPANAFTPSAALVKATLVNSGVNMTGTAAIPANCQGWGRVLLDDALYFNGESRELFVEDDTVGFPLGSSNQTRTFDVTVGSSLEPLKVTLTWTDFPSTPAAAINLINDLDLIVTGPTGTYLGNVFSGGQSTTGGSADRRNTVEQVLIATPQTGNYTVTVRSQTVPSGPQPFALVVTGALTAGGGGACAAEVNFTGGAAGWINSTSRTCSTGLFVVGTPTQVIDGGVRTQLAGDHTTGTGSAFFTATNSSAGVNDVDGGNCIAESPVYPVAAASNVSAWYYFGQRDAGGDAAGDFFRLEISTNGGSTWTTLASFGDQTVNATWTRATTTVPAGANVKFRVQASDGTASGDLVEAGIDDVTICPIP